MFIIVDQSKKEELLTKNMNYRKTVRKEQKQKTLENNKDKYEAMDQSKKEELLTKNMNYKKTMGEEQKQKLKQKLLKNKRAKYQAMDISKKKEMSVMNSSKIMLNHMSLDPKRKNLQLMTLTCALKNFKNKLNLAHFTYAVFVTEHYTKSQW
jgi:hypothetical protein